jgi:hypothetical protein
VCCFSAVRDLLNKTGVSPKQIGFVITNCSLFNPTPSLSATIMHHFGMGASTLNYNLGGMGCSGGRAGPGRGGQGRWRVPRVWADDAPGQEGPRVRSVGALPFNAPGYYSKQILRVLGHQVHLHLQLVSRLT